MDLLPVVFKPPTIHLQASSKHNSIDPGIFNSSQHTDKEAYPGAATVGILKLSLLQKLKTAEHSLALSQVGSWKTLLDKSNH